MCECEGSFGDDMYSEGVRHGAEDSAETIAELRAEIERLRAALAKIAAMPTEQLFREPTRAAVIASAALMSPAK